MTDLRSIDGLCVCGCGEPAVYAEAHCDRKFGARITRTDYEIMDCGYETPCWIWKGRLVPTYRNTTVRGRSIYAHRAMYIQEKGPIPKDYVIDHLCRIRCCIRPEHLEAVTVAENQRRASAVLTERDVKEIRSSAEGAHTLARRYGVKVNAIWAVRKRGTWKDVH